MSKLSMLGKDFGEWAKRKVAPVVLASALASALNLRVDENEALAQSSDLEGISAKIKTEDGLNKLYGGYGRRCMLVVGQVDRIGDTYHSRAEVEAGREFNIDIYCDGNGEIVSTNSGFEGNRQRTSVFTRVRYVAKFDKPGVNILTFKGRGVDRFGKEYLQDMMVTVDVKESRVRTGQLEGVRNEVNGRISLVQQTTTKRINEVERKVQEGRIEIAPNVQLPFPEKDELNARVGYGASLRYVFPVKRREYHYGSGVNGGGYVHEEKGYVHEGKSVVRLTIGFGFDHYLTNFPISDEVQNRIAGLDNVNGSRTLVEAQGGVKLDISENFNLNVLGTLGAMTYTLNGSELAQDPQTKALLATPGDGTTNMNVGIEFGMQAMVNENFGFHGGFKGVKMLKHVPLEAGPNPVTGAPAYWTFVFGPAFRW